MIIMEPVKGGSLAKLPESVSRVFEKANPDVTLSSWALRFAASLEGLVTVLSGMSNIGQMQDNLSTMQNFKPLSADEHKVIDAAMDALNAIERIPCTQCGYCTKDCPQHINIPGIFGAMNNTLVYGNETGAQGNYDFATREGGKASDCLACGQCEAACPQHIDIIERLKTCAEKFEH